MDVKMFSANLFLCFFLVVSLAMISARPQADPCYQLIEKYRLQYVNEIPDKAAGKNESEKANFKHKEIEKHSRKRDIDSLDFYNELEASGLKPLLKACGKQSSYKDALTKYGAPDRLIAVIDHHRFSQGNPT